MRFRRGKVARRTVDRRGISATVRRFGTIESPGGIAGEEEERVARRLQTRAKGRATRRPCVISPALWCPKVLPSHSTRGSALDVANCTITILVAGAGWHRRWPLPASCSLPSVFVTVPVLCTLADALKARQTEYYTNTHLRRPSAVPSATSGLPHTFLNYRRPATVSPFSLCHLVSHPFVCFSFETSRTRKDAILARGCFVFGRDGRGVENGTERLSSGSGETNAPLRDFAFKQFRRSLTDRWDSPRTSICYNG